MYSIYSFHFFKYLGFFRIPQRVAHAAGMPQEASLDIYYYYLKIIKSIIVYVKVQPCGLIGFSIAFQNPNQKILKILFQILSTYLKLFRNFQKTFEILENKKLCTQILKSKNSKYLGFSRIHQRVAHAEGMPQEASLQPLRIQTKKS